MDREASEKTVHEAQQRKFLTKIWAYVVVLVFGVILSLGLWNQVNELPQTASANWQVNQLESAAAAFESGQIVPQVDPDGLSGIGYGSLLFSSPLPSVLAAGIHFFIHSWPIAINILATICLISTGLTMCFSLSKISRSYVLGTIGSLFYLTTPFLLSSVYTDFTIDVLLALAITPLFFWGLFRLINQESHAVRTLAITFALLLLTHSLIATLVVIITIICLLCNLRHLLNLNSLWRIVLTIVVILGLTACFTLPIIEAQLNCSYALFDSSATFALADTEPSQKATSLAEFLLANPNPQNLALGFVILFGLISFWFIYTKIENPAERNFLASLHIITIISATPNLPCFDWSFLPLQLQILGFPIQLLKITALTGSIVASYSIYYIIKDLSTEKQRVSAVLAGVLALFACNPIAFFDARTDQIENYTQESDEKTDDHGDKSTSPQNTTRAHLYYLYAPAAFTHAIDQLEREHNAERDVSDISDTENALAENTEITDDSELETSETEIGNSPKPESKNIATATSQEASSKNSILEQPQVLRGKAEIKNYSSDNHTLTIDNVSEETAITLPILYYPGYIATLNNTELETSVVSNTGLLAIILPSGSKGLIQIRYGLSRATKLGGLLTLATIALGVVWLIIEKLLSFRRSKDQAEAADIVESVREVLEFVEDDADSELIELFNADQTSKDESEEDSEPQPTPPAKKRGRPRKKPANDDQNATNTKQEDTKTKQEKTKSKPSKTKTRQNKTETDQEEAEAKQPDSEEAKPKKRGRPRKNANTDNKTTEKST